MTLCHVLVIHIIILCNVMTLTLYLDSLPHGRGILNGIFFVRRTIVHSISMQRLKIKEKSWFLFSQLLVRIKELNGTSVRNILNPAYLI